MTVILEDPFTINLNNLNHIRNRFTFLLGLNIGWMDLPRGRKVIVRVARSLIFAPAPMLGSSARSAISMACSWCGIMPCANTTSASLNFVDADEAAGAAVVAAVFVVDDPPHAASVRTEMASVADSAMRFMGKPF